MRVSIIIWYHLRIFMISLSYSLPLCIMYWPKKPRPRDLVSFDDTIRVLKILRSHIDYTWLQGKSCKQSSKFMKLESTYSNSSFRILIHPFQFHLEQWPEITWTPFLILILPKDIVSNILVWPEGYWVYLNRYTHYPSFFATKNPDIVLYVHRFPNKKPRKTQTYTYTWEKKPRKNPEICIHVHPPWDTPLVDRLGVFLTVLLPNNFVM